MLALRCCQNRNVFRPSSVGLGAEILPTLILDCVRFDRRNPAAVPSQEGDAGKKCAHCGPALKQPIDRYPRERMQAVGVVRKDVSWSRGHGSRKTCFPGQLEFPCTRGGSIAERIGKVPNRPPKPALKDRLATENLSCRGFAGQLGKYRM